MNIVDQLKAYCECTDVSEKDVNEMIHLISMATCWQRNDPCETFLTGDRREVIDLPSCADCPYIFVPFYRPFDISTFKFYLSKIEGIQETVTGITDFAYNSDGKFYINLGLPSCKCSCDPCGCPPKYRLVVEYVAGYDELPDCILPAFCDVIQVINAKNDCDCEECPCGEDGENNVQYAKGDVVTVSLQTQIGAILTEQYKNMIGQLSLCREEDSLWGFVV